MPALAANACNSSSEGALTICAQSMPCAGQIGWSINTVMRLILGARGNSAHDSWIRSIHDESHPQATARARGRVERRRHLPAPGVLADGSDHDLRMAVVQGIGLPGATRA